ncbi:MAG TPA: tripartite tricarboxylate transporter TctB family protein [Trueperaceae bacterium]|nr:tripartite tricarboxylate transporter TctB family protein [Trueperaceae bacterium]
MTDRFTAAFLLILAVAYGLHARSFRTNFITDPLGPQAWPIMLAVFLALLASYLLVRPRSDARWPHRIVLLRQLVLVAALVGYALLLDPIGFLAATVLVVAFMALLLGARWWQAGTTGLVSSAALYLLFNSVLGLPLPVGALFGG